MIPLYNSFKVYKFRYLRHIGTFQAETEQSEISKAKKKMILRITKNHKITINIAHKNCKNGKNVFIVRIWKCKSILGEGTLWVPSQNSIYFVDIKKKNILVLNIKSKKKKIIKVKK